MSIENGILYKPVDVGELSSVLNYDSLNIGTLCQYAGQNKWAKYKSFLYPAWVFPYNGTQSTPALRQPEKETALKSKNCGLAMITRASSGAAWTAGISLPVGGSDWKHIVPTGGSPAPFRLLDYDGYNPAAAAPFQYGPTPNPAYRRHVIQIDESVESGLADIAMSDLNGDGTQAEGYYYYHNISSYEVFCMLGKRSNDTPASVPSIIYKANSTINKALLSSGIWDCVTVFVDPTTAASIYEGSYVSISGSFVLAPVGRKTFSYSETLGLSYAGSEVSANRATLHMVLATVSGTASYNLMTVLIKNGSITTHSINLNLGQSGTLSTTPTDFGYLTLSPAALSTSTYWLRFWIDGSTFYDEQFYPEESPIL